VDESGAAAGSVSGGCVEAAVYELCRETLRSGVPVRESFGSAGEDAFAIGLTCGGELEVFVQRVVPGEPAAEPFEATARAVAQGTPVALARIVSGPRELLGRGLAVLAQDPEQRRIVGTLGDADLDLAVSVRAVAMLDDARTGTFTVATDGGGGGGLTVFVESHAAAPRLLVFGAIDFAAALVTAGKFLGFRVTVCDARAVFATEARFPDADEVVVDWPHRYLATQHVDRRTAVCVLTHDEKFDVPVLEAALRLPVGYVGAMGSRRTCEQRLARLRLTGLEDTELDLLHAPIGLDLGGRTPQETAIAIVAEIVAARHGGSGARLAAVRTPIHAEPAPTDAKDPVCL
jgi:xanthine dehydrogenase accessory factor